MRMQRAAVIGALAAVVMGGGLMGVVIAGGQNAAAAKSSAGAAASKYSPPRTSWGEPDLQGIWGLGYVMTPLERPKELAGKEFLTDAEVVSLEKEYRERNSGDGAGGRARAGAGSDEDVAGAYNQAFSARGKHEKVIRTKRTSMVVDPPDGKIPPVTPEGQKRLAAFKRNATNEFGPGGRADNPEERIGDRCTGISLPFVKGISGTFSRIVQSPGVVTMYHEDGHQGGVYRAISLNGGPHLPSYIRQWLGDSRGHWEGDTLVVDITNFTNRTNYQGSSENMHLVERYTRTAPDEIIFRVTIEDPTTFARPWTIEIPLTKGDEKQNQIFESACHEGNYAMTSILAGARAIEREQAAKKKSEK